MANRQAIVIGASSPGGLGEAAARRLAADGFAVSLAARRPDSIAALAAEIGAECVACDLHDEDSIATLGARAATCDVLVNAAGTTLGRTIRNVTRGEIESQFDIHVTANILLLKHCAPAMPRGASIILLSSLTATQAGAGLVAYAAAKAALEHVIRIAAIEFGPQGVRVNGVAPGFCDTPMTHSFLGKASINALYSGESALGALVTPAQVAATIAYLAAGDCFTTGEIMQASGGAQLFRMPRFDELRA